MTSTRREEISNALVEEMVPVCGSRRAAAGMAKQLEAGALPITAFPEGRARDLARRLKSDSGSNGHVTPASFDAG